MVSNDSKSALPPNPDGQPGATARDDDRRHSPRLEAEIVVDVEVDEASEHNFFMGLTENLSEGGLFVATHIMRPIGTRLALAFKLPDSEEPIVAKGEVRWVRPFSDDTQAAPGMGVRFVEIDDKQAARVKTVLQARAPIFYDD